jgi:hypothetical protein
MICSKISIGWFLLRITIRPRDIWTIYGAMAITALTGVVFFFVTLFQCNPISYFWDKDGKGTCVNMEVIIALTYLYSACSVICDFTFALLPVVLIWGLNMDKKTKVALIPIVIMACVYVCPPRCWSLLTLHRASAAVVVRFRYVKDFKNPDFLCTCHASILPCIADNVDATVDIAIWSTTEQGLAVIAGSLATLRPLLRMVGRFGSRASQKTPASNCRDDTPALFSDRPRDGQRANGKDRSMIMLTELGDDDAFNERATRTDTNPENWRQASDEELTGGSRREAWDERCTDKSHDIYPVETRV